VDGTGSESCPVVSFGISGAEASKYKIELNCFTIKCYVYLHICVNITAKLIPGSYCCVC
jgi:hypothetical protein